MSEKFFPFDSVNGDRAYLAKDFRKYFKTIITSGVFAGGDNLPVRSAGGLNITVGLGFAWVEGALYEVEGTPLPFALSPGATNPRIDRVVVRLDIAARKVYTTVVQGTPAASPVAPALVRNGDFYDLGLATITVPASAISITNSAIQDTRTNSAVCGVVRSPVEVLDVDAFMVNCQTAFDEWFSNLEEQFSGDVAGNLQNQINAIRSDLDNGVYSTTAVLHLHTVPGAAVTLTFGNVTLSATANAQGLADLYPNKLGTWTASVHTSNGTYTGTVDVTYIGIFDASLPTLQNMKWADINAVGAAGAASVIFKRGDTKTVTLTTGEVITLRLEDFNHDDRSSGGKAPMTFMMVDGLNATAAMNSSNTNAGGWNSSAMRSRMSTYLSQLPADLRAVIKPVIKKTTAGSQSTTIQNTTDSLWLASMKEVGLLTTSTGYSGEGETYPLFTDNASRIKKVNGSAAAWWSRSPYTGSSTNFYCVSSSGSNVSYYASTSSGVVLGLCV